MKLKIEMEFTPNLISVEWLNKNIEHPQLIVLDATINKVIDNESLRIPKARFFDIKMKFSDIEAPFPSALPKTEHFEEEARTLGVNNHSLIVVYDDKGVYSSARAWWLFKTFGFNNVAVLDGGLPEWKQNGFKVENYKNEMYALGNFKADFNSDLMTNFKGVNDYYKDKNTLILDARSADRFQCKVDEPRAGLRRGTIPNSKNLPYTDLFNGNTFKPITELLEIFNNLVKTESQIVFSCGSGITACILALGATLCNYKNLIVYDGSWTEYGSLTEN